MHSSNVLRLPAVEVNQSPGRTLYMFAVDGKIIPTVATVSRIKRQNGRTLEGYQRSEVYSHIAEIRTYLENPAPMIPNAIVIAFDRRVRFEPDSKAASPLGYTQSGVLVIPVNTGQPDEEKPGFVVDGQQRLAAIRDAKIGSFPICVTAFITDDVRDQAEQFILVNSTKPLPKGLIYELLPGTEGTLPALLQRRRFPAYLMERLNYDAESPLKGLIQTATNPGGITKDNSVLRMLEGSLTDGVLFRFRGAYGVGEDSQAMLAVLFSFWRAVSCVFLEAWGLHPRKSRLMHGAGIVSLGFLMDAIADRYRSVGVPATEQFGADLLPLKPVCRWTDGYWDFGPGQQRKWNEIQNTSKDIQLLSNYLLVQYKAKVWARPADDDLKVVTNVLANP
jgi:DGQHR domain-containing protein